MILMRFIPVNAKENIRYLINKHELNIVVVSERKTIDINLKETTISTKGRHDPCVGIRAVQVGEAMLATTIADHCIRYF